MNLMQHNKPEIISKHPTNFENKMNKLKVSDGFYDVVVKSIEKKFESLSITNKCIWTHIINTNNIDLDKDLSILKSEDIKKCNKTWKGKRNQFEPN